MLSVASFSVSARLPGEARCVQPAVWLPRSSNNFWSHWPRSPDSHSERNVSEEGNSHKLRKIPSVQACSVPETWENKISISNKFFLSLALGMPSSHPAGCRPLRSAPQGFGQGLVKAGGPVMVGLGGRRRRKARYLISSCFLHFCFH